MDTEKSNNHETRASNAGSSGMPPVDSDEKMADPAGGRRVPRLEQVLKKLAWGILFVPGGRTGAARWMWRGTVVFLLVTVLALALKEGAGHARLQAAELAGSAPVVPVVRVGREDLYSEVAIPAEFRPYAEVELHAKISGYVQEMKVDFGDQVKAGQLLARLEVPELKDELDRAHAVLSKAEADYHEAHLAYTRLLAVDQQHPNLVAQQELDTAEAKDRATGAAIAGAKAEVEKDQTLLDYTRITAPFDGVVTHRYADPGALIQAGTTSQTQSLPLFRLANNYRLRLDFPVSVAYVRDVRLGDPVEVRVESLGDRGFTGRICRFSGQVNEETRTMITELEVPNPALELMPGMYAKVVLKVEKCEHVVAIPIEAVAAGKEATVLVVNAHQQIEQRPVTLGLETPTRYEVKAGLKEGESVVVGSHAGLTPGETVMPKLIGSLAQR